MTSLEHQGKIPMRLVSLSSLAAVALCAIVAGTAGCAADAADSNHNVTAEEAEAATTAPVVEYRTEGGFTMYSADVKVFASGLVIATEKFHDGKTLSFTDKLTHAEIANIKSFIKSDFVRLPSKLYQSSHIMDMPAIIIVAHGHTVTLEPTFGTPVAPSSFTALSGAMSEQFGKTAGKELVRYEVSGGFAFSHTLLTVTNNGECHLVEEGLHTADKACWVERASLITLHSQLEAKQYGAYTFYDLPSKLPAPPVADGLSFAVTWDGPQGKKTVSSGTAASEPAQFQHVRETLQSIVIVAEQQ